MILIGNTCVTDSQIGKPRIVEEEDRPFPDVSTPASNGQSVPQDIPGIIQLNDQRHSHEVDNFKNTTGKHILYGCLIAMAIAATADAAFHLESSILTNAFEVAKIVATTILGYFFGSKAK